MLTANLAKRNIRFKTYLAKKTARVPEYIVDHEMAHPDLPERFLTLMDRVSAAIARLPGTIESVAGAPRRLGD